MAYKHDNLTVVKIVGERLRAIRENKGLTRKDIIDGLGYAESSISNWELGNHNLALDVLYAYAKFLGVQAKDLLPSNEEINDYIHKTMSTQHDPNAAYNAEVKRIAEILAGDDFPAWATAKLDVSDSCRAAWEIGVKRNMSKARAMVAEMEHVARALMDNSGMYQDWEIDEYLKERGLIPNTKTNNDAR